MSEQNIIKLSNFKKTTNDATSEIVEKIEKIEKIEKVFTTIIQKNTSNSDRIAEERKKSNLQVLRRYRIK